MAAAPIVSEELKTLFSGKEIYDTGLWVDTI
jgi:hypothetical protein